MALASIPFLIKAFTTLLILFVMYLNNPLDLELLRHLQAFSLCHLQQRLSAY